MLKYLLIFGALQGFIFAFTLLTIKNPKRVLTNRIFAILIIVVSLFLAISSQEEAFAEYPKLFLTSYVLIYLYCPLYYLLIESLTNSNFSIKRSHIFLAVPALLYFTVLSRYLFLTDEMIINLLKGNNYLDLTIVDVVSISLNIYIVVKSWLMLKHSDGRTITYAHERAFAFLSLVILMSNLAWVYVIIPQFGIASYSPSFRLESVYVAMSFMIFVFGYVLILRAEHFSIRTMVDQVRYRNVNIEPAIINSIEQRIVDVLESSKPYKQTDFSLDQLAQLAEIEKFKISYTISNAMDTNFTSLINKYRVEEFIALFHSNGFSNYSLLGIANEAGFSSKSTFYKAFKEIKGTSPKDYFNVDSASDLIAS